MRADGVRRPIAGERRAIPHVGPAGGGFDKGYLFMQRPPDWPALAMERGTLFVDPRPARLQPRAAPALLDYLRAPTDLPVFYNAAVIDLPTSQDVGLLGVRYLVIPTGIASPLPGDGRRTRAGLRPRGTLDVAAHVSVVASWTVVDSTAAALQGRHRPRLRSCQRGRPRVRPRAPAEPGAAPGTASAQDTLTSSLTIDASASAPSVVVVRSTYDDGWTATVDGEPADVAARRRLPPRGAGERRRPHDRVGLRGRGSDPGPDRRRRGVDRDRRGVRAAAAGHGTSAPTRASGADGSCDPRCRRPVR